MIAARLPVRLLRIFAAVLAVALVWASLDGRDALDRLAAVRPGWALAALAALTVQVLLSAIRWRLTARQFGLHIPFGHALREYYLAQMVNQILPGGIAGDIGRALRSAAGAGLLPAGQAVALERLAGNAVLFAVLVAASVAAALAPGGPVIPGGALRVIGFGAAVIVAFALLALVPAGQGRLARAAAGLRGAVALGLLAPGVFGRQILPGLGTVAANITAFACAARATGTDLPVLAALVLVPLILFSMLVPLTVSGWGLREGAAAALFPLAGASPEAGLAASVIFGLMFLVSSLPGLFVLLADGLRSRPGARATLSDPSDP